MSLVGQSRRFGAPPTTSDLPQPTDIETLSRLVRLVPDSVVAASFDHLVGAGEKRRWDLQAQFFGRWLVNHQFELRGGLNRKIGWTGPSHYSVDIGCSAAHDLLNIDSVREQTARCAI
jgi:hypothetical protein